MACDYLAQNIRNDVIEKMMVPLKTSLICMALVGAAGTVSAQIKVENAWVRTTVANQQATGAFMKITSAEAVKLTAVSTAVAGVNEVHEMKMEGDVMKMRALPKGLDIPTNTTVELKSGGYHLMMMALKQRINSGEAVPIELQFTNAKGQKQTVLVNAKASFNSPYKP